MPEDSQLARAQGIVTEIPQRRFSGARNWRGKPDPPFFTGGCAQIIKIQVPNSKLQIQRELVFGSSPYPVTFTLIPSECAVNSGAYMHCMVVTPLEKSPF